MPPSAGTEAPRDPICESPSPAPTPGRADCARHTVDRPGYRRPGYQRERRVPSRAADRFPCLSWRAARCERRLRLERQALDAPCGLDLEPVAAGCDGIGAGLTADPDVVAASCPLDTKARTPTLPRERGRATSAKGEKSNWLGADQNRHAEGQRWTTSPSPGRSWGPHLGSTSFLLCSVWASLC